MLRTKLLWLFHRGWLRLYRILPKRFVRNGLAGAPLARGLGLAPLAKLGKPLLQLPLARAGKNAWKDL